MLSHTFAISLVESNLVKQALEGEFPKLLRLLSDLWTRLNQSISASNASDMMPVLLDENIELNTHKFE